MRMFGIICLVHGIIAHAHGHDLVRGIENFYSDYLHQKQDDRYRKDLKKRHSHAKKMQSNNNAHRTVDEILSNISKNFDQIQRNCTSRHFCLNEEKKILLSKSQHVGQKHPAYKSLQDLANLIPTNANKDLFLTQLFLLKNMTKEAQYDYKNGVRIRPWYEAPKTFFKRKSPPPRGYYVLDDVLNIALQKIEKNHKQCQNREQCIESDKAILLNLTRQLDKNDPSLTSLKRMIKDLNQVADKQIYDGNSFVKFYRTKGAKEASTVSFYSKDRHDWENIKKKMPKEVYKEARITENNRYDRSNSSSDRPSYYYDQERQYNHQKSTPQSPQSYYDQERQYNPQKSTLQPPQSYYEEQRPYQYQKPRYKEDRDDRYYQNSQPRYRDKYDGRNQRDQAPRYRDEPTSLEEKAQSFVGSLLSDLFKIRK